MLTFGKRFFLSGLAILQSLDFVGLALPAINNLKSRWAVPTLSTEEKKKGRWHRLSSLWLHRPEAGATIGCAPPCRPAAGR